MLMRDDYTMCRKKKAKTELTKVSLSVEKKTYLIFNVPMHGKENINR